jgi:hypothetical protein
LPPGNRQPRPGAANFGVAAGSITAVNGSTLTVKDRTGPMTATFSAATQLLREARVGANAITKGSCAFVRGTSTDKGVTVEAQAVNLSAPTANGCAGPMFRGR